MMNNQQSIHYALRTIISSISSTCAVCHLENIYSTYFTLNPVTCAENITDYLKSEQSATGAKSKPTHSAWTRRVERNSVHHGKSQRGHQYHRGHVKNWHHGHLRINTLSNYQTCHRRHMYNRKLYVTTPFHVEPCTTKHLHGRHQSPRTCIW